jgi:hypothetical protein
MSIYVYIIYACIIHMIILCGIYVEHCGAILYRSSTLMEMRAPPIELGRDLAVNRPAVRQDGIVSFQMTRSELHGQVAMRFVGLGLGHGTRWEMGNSKQNLE